MLHLFDGMDFHTGIMLFLLLLLVLFYEAINGFHDTANAIATVIYTRALRYQLAVAMSGLFNFLGVLMGGLSVAYTIVHLLPIDLLLNVSSAQGLAMIFSMLLAAIIWNLGTWYFGLPASSFHTLIGSIIGISLTNALLIDNSIVLALNLPKLMEIFLSLLISPLVGLTIAGTIVFLLRYYWSNTKKRRRIHMTPKEREKKDGKRKPPFWTRIALILSAAGVSFSHGANDGQKGIGLIMLVLIGVAPAGFVVNMNASSYDISRTRDAVHHLQQYYTQHQCNFNIANVVMPFPQQTNKVWKRYKSEVPILHEVACELSQALMPIHSASLLLSNLNRYDELSSEQRSYLRRLLMCLSDITNQIAQLQETPTIDQLFLKNLQQDLLYTVEYAPLWIIIIVAFALALGTMVGWRRVATTIGEKIGKKDMTYAQGLSAQMTAAVFIGIASYTGMPVSTTHVLSSAVTGTMLVDGNGIHSKTIKNIIIAWILTLPVTIILASGIYRLIIKFI
ncbi:inorganic phosphate transporter PitA [Candidatus Palibaumannia cicadellinicola]|nr:inorganic phosphate transporter PitA [Candidatus Baumannia cicadellinicola]MBS0032593.1 inorganic phosphate transporter PitA [Candidatus Baumannia cicadellinicola]MCJ7462494.1 inorganic phosphate transporter PitA [Candidatus Baumannia cicadellinicola]MCJ7462623.1 inorganic phosphate transporter PitA [Candidatus Baumannia cicadellinicola]